MVAVAMQISCIRFFLTSSLSSTVTGTKLPALSYKLQVNHFKPNKRVTIFFVIIAVALLRLGECGYQKSLLELPERSNIDTSA